ncbi:MAG: alpha/beta hydrolase [Odoribacter splanchnicus]
MKTITLNDGEKVLTRLCLPEGPVKTIVFAIHGTGPNTYLNKRSGFNFYDVMAEGFCSQGVAFFSYNRRGVEVGDTAPRFDRIDSAKYAKYSPSTEAEDVERMVHVLKKDKRFKDCRIILYGMSEGTIIASMVAERKKVKVDALFLHGYANENMYDIIRWQNSGEGILIMVNSIFDKDGDKASVAKSMNLRIKWWLPTENIYSGFTVRYGRYRKDGRIDIKDIAPARLAFHDTLMQHITAKDDAWISNHYFRITTAWCRECFALEANKTRLVRVNIPIHIFHGTTDAHVPIEGVYDLASRFKVCGKDNLTLHIFENHNHDLNFQDWLTQKKYSAGLKELFECAGKY